MRIHGEVVAGSIRGRKIAEPRAHQLRVARCHHLTGYRIETEDAYTGIAEEGSAAAPEESKTDVGA